MAVEPQDGFFGAVAERGFKAVLEQAVVDVVQVSAVPDVARDACVGGHLRAVAQLRNKEHPRGGGRGDPTGAFGAAGVRLGIEAVSAGRVQVDFRWRGEGGHAEVLLVAAEGVHRIAGHIFLADHKTGTVQYTGVADVGGVLPHVDSVMRPGNAALPEIGSRAECPDEGFPRISRSRLLRRFGRRIIFVVPGIERKSRKDLFQVADALDAPGLVPGFLEDREQHRGQYRDDRYPLKFKLINFSAVFCLFCIIQDFDTNHYS